MLLSQSGELTAQEVKEEAPDVVAPFAEGGEADGVAPQAVEKRRPEAPGGDRLSEIRVGGGQDAHVGLHRLFAPQRLDLAALQGAQEERLHLLRSLADLV